MASPDFISESVTFETLHLTAVSARCIICGNNPPVFKPNQNGGAYCLPCACRLLAEMAERSIDQWIITSQAAG